MTSEESFPRTKINDEKLVEPHERTPELLFGATFNGMPRDGHAVSGSRAEIVQSVCRRA
jgi:hypothetical protein